MTCLKYFLLKIHYTTMIVIMNMLYLLSQLVVGFILTTIFITGYFGLLITSLLFIILGIITAFSVFYPDEYEILLENYKILYDKRNLNHVQILISPCKQYYTFRGIQYDIAFPLYWALNETPNSGPHHCENCKDYGMFRGVFIMYCVNCAKYVYDETRGYGAITNGVEMGGSDINKSAWNTYLKYRDLTKIGLPEELKNINFNRPGYKYGLVYFIEECSRDDDAVDEELISSRWYPGFVYDYDYEYNDDDYETLEEYIQKNENSIKKST